MQNVDSIFSGLSLHAKDLSALTPDEVAIQHIMGQILGIGRVVGLWEFDTATSQIVWNCFVKKNKALQQAVDRMEEFVRSQLGDSRSFSLDSPKGRVPRIEALRKEAGAW